MPTKDGSNLVIVFGSEGQLGNLLARNHEEVDRRLRLYVVKGYAL